MTIDIKCHCLVSNNATTLKPKKIIRRMLLSTIVLRDVN